MQIYVSGEVLLLLFPFSDGSGSKRRPAVAMLDTGDDDVVVALITSQAQGTKFDVQLRQWQSAGLMLPSLARVHKLATLQKNLVDRSLGQLTSDDWTNVQAAILQLWLELP
jgi:mRNA interferase MazF